MITIYGIKNCNTMQKAFSWLDERQIEYRFHDYKKEGIDVDKLLSWLKKSTLGELINNKGTTYRNLTEKEKEALIHPEKCLPIIQKQTSVIKRPIIEYQNKLLIGFNPEIWLNTFK
ncbi:MAG: Spx/MgsR family RNA polymerase-binding regulatory protein [Bacteroidetes bacterium]|nr:MAG: Spx/MgsR family RNA polymerase-binding regulatory protein [Bacteroidota bacterium]